MLSWKDSVFFSPALLLRPGTAQQLYFNLSDVGFPQVPLMLSSVGANAVEDRSEEGADIFLHHWTIARRFRPARSPSRICWEGLLLYSGSEDNWRTAPSRFPDGFAQYVEEPLIGVVHVVDLRGVAQRDRRRCIELWNVSCPTSMADGGARKVRLRLSVRWAPMAARESTTVQPARILYASPAGVTSIGCSSRFNVSRWDGCPGGTQCSVVHVASIAHWPARLHVLRILGHLHEGGRGASPDHNSCALIHASMRARLRTPARRACAPTSVCTP